MSKTNRKIFIWLIAHRKRLTAWALLVAFACLSPWPHGASAAEINAATTAKPAGFADIVAKVKPALGGMKAASFRFRRSSKSWCSCSGFRN
jgi:hypothetical protein